MKEIDLRQIFEKHIYSDIERIIKSKPFTWLLIKDAMREACNQAIEFCAEEAKVSNHWNGGISGTVDKQSILKCKEAIK